MVDVGSQHPYIPARLRAEILEQRHGERVCLFSGTAARGPTGDAALPFHPFSLFEFGEEGVTQPCEMLRMPKKVGFVDGDMRYNCAHHVRTHGNFAERAYDLLKRLFFSLEEGVHRFLYRIIVHGAALEAEVRLERPVQFVVVLFEQSFQRMFIDCRTPCSLFSVHAHPMALCLQ
jgi:hypothetical protein